MSNNNTTQRKFQLNPRDNPETTINFNFRFDGFSLFCDECSSPLWLYGANFIESYSNGYANTLRCLCDLHAEELGLEVAK
jgi:hypothetical protein